MVAFARGGNQLQVVATRGAAIVRDAIEVTYQTAPWGRPARLRLVELGRKDNVVSVAATMYDSEGVACLDSRNVVRFSLAGAGRLIDNLGTARGSRELQLYNGRAEISLTRKGACSVGVVSDGLPAALLDLS